jgi:uncharacterized protein (DUF1697 family)
MSTRHIALLRGINVGGKNKLPMKDLAALFEEAGCRDVRTFIQSGNVIFDVAPRVSAKVSQAVAAGIAKRFGFSAPVVLRTAEELQKVLRDNPFLRDNVDEDHLHVLFLADEPAPRSLGDLDPKRSPGDAFIARGREIYLRLPNGVARTKLTNAYFDSKLSTVTTGRNWRTLTKLCELATL